MATSKPNSTYNRSCTEVNRSTGNSPYFRKNGRKCKYSSIKVDAKHPTQAQQISKKDVETEEETEEPSSSPILGRVSQLKSNSLTSSASLRNASSPCHLVHTMKSYPFVISKCSSPARVNKTKTLFIPNSVLPSPSHKKFKNNISKSIMHKKDLSPLHSPVGSRKSVIPESPSSLFMNKDDSLLESIDFDELDSVCSSMMSTPKRVISSGENKRTPLSNQSNNPTYYNLRNTPRRLGSRKKLVTKVDVISVFDKNTLSCVDRETVNDVSPKSSKSSKLRASNTKCLRLNTAFDKCINSAVDKDADQDSPDLFDETRSLKSQDTFDDNCGNVSQKTEKLCDQISDIFECSFDALNTSEAQCEVQVTCAKENDKNNRCRNFDSKHLSAISKTSEVNKNQMSVGNSSCGKSEENTSIGSAQGSASFISPNATSNLGLNVLSSESVSSSDSQMSFTSTIDSQPLIGRLQGRLKGLQASQPSGVVQSENERRAEAVAAALEEAKKIQQRGNDFELGPFFGLPSMVAEVLKNHRSISELYDWQKECIAEGSHSDNLLFSLPTSGGKTLVAEILMLRQLLLKRRDTLFILPYVALVQEKVHGLSPFGVELGFLIEEYAGSRGSYPPKSGRKKCVLYVATIEKASGLVNSLLENDRISELGLVVADEVHMLGEGSGRGATLEGTLTKLRFAAPKVQLVAMSATIGNIQELGTFLNAKVYSGNFRPIVLTEYVKIGEHIWELNSAAHTEEELLHKQRLCCFPYTKEQKQLDVDMIGGLVGEVVPDHSCIVFCPTRRNCETLAELICRILPKDLTKNRRMDKVALYRALVEEGGGTVCPTLRKTVPFGVAYHHSGLTEGERRLIEEGYLEGTLCCLCCTSTLAAGVNLPARRVIIRSPYTGSEFLSRARYKQMVGRAGRAGLDTCGESFLILQLRDIKQTGKLLMSPMDVCHSTLVQRDDRGLISLLFSSMGLGIAVSLPTLKALVASSLLALQGAVHQVDLDDKVLQIVENLRKISLVRIKDPTNKEDTSQAATSICTSGSNEEKKSQGSEKKSQGSDANSCARSDLVNEAAIQILNRSVVDSDVLSVSRLGRAAIKGNIDLNLASQLYSDLCLARESLAVNSHLHLLYLVVPYDIATSVKVVPDVLYKAFLDLGEEEVKVAKLLGITEAVLIKLTMGQKSKKVTEHVLQRFYISLILHHLWVGIGIWQVSEQFHIHRGFTQQLLTAASAFASCVHHFCQELEELWAFRDLLSTFSRQLSGCCSAELLPLLDLPTVKKGRAKMLYNAGYRTLHDIANAEPKVLVENVDHLPYRTAVQIINSAKMLLLEKAETLQGEAEEVLLGLQQPNPKEVAR